MRWESREPFARHRLQRKPLVSDLGMYHGTCVTHVLWCMSGLLTRGGGKTFPGIPGACVTRNFTYLWCICCFVYRSLRAYHYENIEFRTTGCNKTICWTAWRPIDFESVICGLSAMTRACGSAQVNMMTSSNGNIFRVTGPLCANFTGHRWIPSQRPVTWNFVFFFHLCLNKRLGKQSWGWWFEMPSRSLWRHCNEPTIGISGKTVCVRLNEIPVVQWLTQQG